MTTKKKLPEPEPLPEPVKKTVKKKKAVITHTIAAPATVVTTTAPQPAIDNNAFKSVLDAYKADLDAYKEELDAKSAAITAAPVVKNEDEILGAIVKERLAAVREKILATPVEDEPEPAKPTIIERLKSFKHWKLVLIIAAILILAWIVSGVIVKHQVNKSIKETKQTEVKIENGKARLEESEANLTVIQRSILSDSAITEKLNELYVLVEAHKKHDAKVIELNETLNRQKNELQNKYSTASDDSLRIYGERAKQK
jgi:uncharacterized membrane-anchored protein YhcB (DUF1043 family)